MSGKSKKFASVGWEQCHTGNNYVFTSPHGVKIYAGGETRGVDPLAPDIDIVVSLIGDLRPKPVIALNGAGELFPNTTRSLNKPALVFDFPDMSIPRYQREFWLKFAEEIDNLGNGKSVLFYCVGGHGRTGMTISILRGIWYPNSGDPVQYVRDHYCDRVVESKSQVDYVEKITGVEVSVKAAKVPAYGNTVLSTGADWGSTYGYQYASKSTGKCQICGKRESETSVVTKSGEIMHICSECEEQMYVIGDAIVGIDNSIYYVEISGTKVIKTIPPKVCAVCGKPAREFVVSSDNGIVGFCGDHFNDLLKTGVAGPYMYDQSMNTVER